MRLVSDVLCICVCNVSDGIIICGLIYIDELWVNIRFGNGLMMKFLLWCICNINDMLVCVFDGSLLKVMLVVSICVNLFGLRLCR